MSAQRTSRHRTPAFLLTADEEVTLRRVAFGQSEVRMMRAADLDRLRRLQLIEEGADGPRLTLAGRTHFDSLPKGVFVGMPRQYDERLPAETGRLPVKRR